MNDENIDEDNPDNAENGEQDLNEALENSEEALDDGISATSDEELELARAAEASAKDDYVRLQAEMQNLRRRTERSGGVVIIVVAVAMAAQILLVLPERS